MTYSIDLKISCCNYYRNNNTSLRECSKIFGIPKSTIGSWLQDYPKCNKNTNTNINNNVMKGEYLSFIKKSLDYNHFQTKLQLVNKINERFNISFTTYHISKILRIICYSRKKVTRQLYNKNIQKIIYSRKQFKHILKNINKDDIICIDETGITRDTVNCYGYDHTSKRLHMNVDIHMFNQKRTIISAISNKKIIHHVNINKSANADVFYDFLKPVCEQHTGKYFLMDNVQFHKSNKIKNLIDESGNNLLFIPPYSPMFNPIEEVFGQFKSYIRGSIFEILKRANIDEHIYNFFTNIKINLQNYYNHAFGS